MNAPYFKARQQSFEKSFFRAASAVLFVLTLGSAVLAGCSKDAAPEKQANAEKWTKIMDDGGKRPDLILAFQAEIHEKFYQKAAQEFGKSHNCTVKLMRVRHDMLMEPLQDAMDVGGDVPDVVELLEGTMGYFAAGPLEKVGFVDLTDRLREEGYMNPDKMVQSRYSLWSSRGHIFAIPHDIHPVALCYRVDLIEKLGIDVTKLKTWDDFVKVGRQITGEWEETDKALGIVKGGKRYMIDFADDSTISLVILLRQHGLDFFTANGDVAFDNPEVADLIAWYVHQTSGPDRISFSAGDGQIFYSAMSEGVSLFFLTPDWRTMLYTRDLGFNNMAGRPHFLKGKLALMPMPVWTDENGNRLPGSYGTSTWGGTGLAITKRCKKQKLAWEFAKFLYLETDDEDSMDRFKETNIIPPIKKAWMANGFNDDSPFFKQMVRDEQGKLVAVPISLGRFYASMADDTSPEYCTAYITEAEMAILEIYYAARDYYKKHIGDPDVDKDMLELIRKQLKEKADLIRQKMK